jgi:pyruvate dehydrogenase E1 component
MEEIGKRKADEAAIETQEWLQSLDKVLDRAGPERVCDLFQQLSGFAQLKGVRLPFTAQTPYINTIPPTEQPLMLALNG